MSSGSPVVTLQKFRTTGIAPPSPPVVSHLSPFALWLAFPTLDYYGDSVTLRVAPFRPSRALPLQYVRACFRQFTHPLPELVVPCRTGRGCSGKALIPPHRSMPSQVRYGRPQLDRMGLNFKQFSLCPGTRVLPHDGSAPSPRLRLLRQALVPLPFRVQVSRMTQEPSSEFFPSARGILH